MRVGSTEGLGEVTEIGSRSLSLRPIHGLPRVTGGEDVDPVVGVDRGYTCVEGSG